MRWTPPATASSPPSTVPRARSTAPAPSVTTFPRSDSKCVRGCTPASASELVRRWPGSPSTSAHAWRRSHGPARSSSPFVAARAMAAFSSALALIVLPPCAHFPTKAATQANDNADPLIGVEVGRRRARPPSLLFLAGLRRSVAVCVLAGPACVWAGVGAEAAVWILSTALLDVRTIQVGVPGLPRICPRDHVAPVGPEAVREGPHRTDVQVVAAEWTRPPGELLPVGVARRAAQPRRGRPGERCRRARCRESVDGRHRTAVGAVAERPLRAVARVVEAVPPDRVHRPSIDRDVRQALEAAATARVLD